MILIPSLDCISDFKIEFIISTPLEKIEMAAVSGGILPSLIAKKL